MNSTRWMAGLCALFALLIISPIAEARPDRVRTDTGQLEGLGPQASGVREFLGVPYAQPPVGALRFREPQPLRRWRGVRDAKQFANACMQRPIFADMVFRYAGVSEDCLYLNIWTPATERNAALPVLFYVYGGGFLAGDGSEKRYDGEALARRGIIVVTVNYRLGVFGFFAHPELTAESPFHASGNQGLLDQAAALDWVRRNIAAFGGDPARITVAGESAGSMSAHGLVVSPLSRGMIARAVGESGSLMTITTSLRDAEQTDAAWATSAGAPSLAQLRALTAEDLQSRAAQQGAPWFSPIVDGYMLPKSPREIMEAGEQAHVPTMAGSTSAESDAAAILRGAAPTIENYRAALARDYAARADEVFQHYPASGDGEPVLDAAQALASDRFIAYATWAWLDAATRTGGARNFYYLYARPRPAPVAGWVIGRPRGAVHSADIEYFMGNLNTNEVYAWTADDHRLSEIMQGYLANFVKTGDPNGDGLPPWYDFASGWRQTLDANVRAESDTSRARYEFYATLPR